ncbi:MAG: hypothetical protein PHC53_00600 [Patescibacteria group bacterium]|nr:hypothetical protein [Patescibacteria group bacterium]
MIKHLRNLLKQGRPKMRFALTVVSTLLLSACASLSQRPTDLQPAMVVAMEKSPPSKPRPEPQWDDCFNEALQASPGLVPELAQDCCRKTQVTTEVLNWCTRHAIAVRDFETKVDRRSDFYLFRRLVWESDFCHLLMGLPRKGEEPLAIPPTGIETTIQCKLSNSMARPGPMDK